MNKSRAREGGEGHRWRKGSRSVPRLTPILQKKKKKKKKETGQMAERWLSKKVTFRWVTLLTAVTETL